MFFKNLVPYRIKLYFHHKAYSKRYKISFGKGAQAYGSVFEGNNFINNGSAIINSKVGRGTYFAGNSKIRKAKIGRFCSIGQNVQTGFGIHPTDWLSTHPAFFSLKKQSGFTFVREQLYEEHKFIDSEKNFYIEIGNDVWIGNDVRIMDGVSIGDGAVIAMSSIVTKDVAPYSIVGGIPAKLIKYRFSDAEISILLKNPWWDHDYDWLRRNNFLFTKIDNYINYLKK